MKIRIFENNIKSMIMSFKEKYGLVSRIGTKEEISDIAVLLALGCYEDAITFSAESELSDKVHELGMSKYLELNKNIFEKEMQGSLFVNDYTKKNIQIFSCFLQNEENNNTIIIYEFHFIKTKSTFSQMTDISGVYFDFDKEEKLIKKNKLGRLPKPTEKSLIKALKIDKEYSNIRDITTTLDDICKKHELAKSTYYRIQKWLVVNPLINLCK